MTENSIDQELECLENANLIQYLPGYLFTYFKDDFSQNILPSLIRNLDQLIQSVQANNSFKILSLNDHNESVDTRRSAPATNDCSLSSSLSDTTMNACKSLLVDISGRLYEIFLRYHDEFYRHVTRFQSYETKYQKEFESMSQQSNSIGDLIVYQKSILTEKFSSRHYNLLNVLFRNVFDWFQKINNTAEGEEPLEDDNDHNNSTLNNSNNNSLLIDSFHKINRVLFNLDLFDHLCGDIVVEVVENKIRQHIENSSLDNLHESFVEPFEIWLDRIIIGWIKLIYSQSETESARNNRLIDDYLFSYNKQLSYLMYTHYANVRIKQLFDIIVDYPDSKSSIDDLRVCLAKTSHLRPVVIKQLKHSIESRLLHPGVETKSILSFFVDAIKALLDLDSTGVMMENVCEPLRKYLRQRDDTIKSIVANLTGEGDSNTNIMEEFCKDLDQHSSSECMIDSTTAAPFVLDTSRAWMQWQPDPIDALTILTQNSNNNTNSAADMAGSKSNIIGMLVNIYGSKEMFINEYKSLLADRLLANHSYNMEKEIRNLELLKLKFGESNLFSCEAMLKDISESKRINANILEQLRKKSVDRIGSFEINPNSLRTMILSEQFWPKLRDEEIEMPAELAKIQQAFKSSYETFKGNRTLIWKNNLGLVNLEIELDDKQKLEFSVTPAQAAVIVKFQEKDSWSLQELSQSLRMSGAALRKKILFWKMQGILKEQEESDESSAQTSEGQNNEVYVLVKDNNKVARYKKLIDLEEEGGEAKNNKPNEILKEQEIVLLWNYTRSMLNGAGNLPIDRIHSWLKMYANPEVTIEQVKYLLDLKVREQLIKYSAGLYRLNKGI